MLILVVSTFYFLFSTSLIRYHSLVLFLSTILFYLFLNRYLKNDPPRFPIRVFFIILSVIAVTTQYYLSFLLLSMGLTIWIKLGFRRFLSYCIDMAVPAIVLLILASTIADQVNTYCQIEESSPTLLGALNFIIVNTENSVVAGNYLQNYHMGRWFIRGLYLIFFAGALIYYKKFHSDVKSLAFVYLFLIVCLAGLYEILNEDYINFWHILFLFITIMLSFFAISSVFPRSFFVPLYVVLILINLGSAVFFQKPERSLSTINDYLLETASQGENILIYPNLYKDMFQHHYTGTNELIPFPINIDYNKGFLIKSWAIKHEQQLDSFFVAHRSSSGFIFMENYTNLMNVDFKFKQLDDYLNSNFNLITDTIIGPYRLRKLSFTD